MSYAHVGKMEESGRVIKAFHSFPNIHPEVLSLLFKLFWSKFFVVVVFGLPVTITSQTSKPLLSIFIINV